MIQIKARNARNSRATTKFCNADMDYISLKLSVHDFCRGSLAEKIVEISPAHLSKVHFAGSGSEANESAVKIAWSYHKHKGNPGKRKIISRVNGYHGSTIFATRLSGIN